MYRREEVNPWGLSNKPSNSSKPTKASAQPKSKKSNSSSGSTNAKNETKKSAQTFLEAQSKHIEAAKKHIIDYESSSDEELASDSLLDSVFKGYGGDKEELQKTQQFLENVFQSGTATCLICIATVKRSDHVNITYYFLFNLLFYYDYLHFRYGHVNTVTVFFI